MLHIKSRSIVFPKWSGPSTSRRWRRPFGGASTQWLTMAATTTNPRTGDKMVSYRFLAPIGAQGVTICVRSFGSIFIFQSTQRVIKQSESTQRALREYSENTQKAHREHLKWESYHRSLEYCVLLLLSSPSPKFSPPRPKTKPKPVKNLNLSPIGTGVTLKSNRPPPHPTPPHQ